MESGIILSGVITNCKLSKSKMTMNTNNFVGFLIFKDIQEYTSHTHTHSHNAYTQVYACTHTHTYARLHACTHAHIHDIIKDSKDESYLLFSPPAPPHTHIHTHDITKDSKDKYYLLFSAHTHTHTHIY